MEKTAFDARYQEYLAAIEDYLNSLFAEKPHWADLYEAMRYSVLSGGKRLRPVMTLEFARLCGLDWHKAVPVGCALELVHTYSLIHDDLPCMDDDDLRRGKPTNHKVYGETLAVLAGDALQPAAYRLILTAPGLTDAQRADCALILANASGPDGMVAGQVLDTLHHPSAQDELTEVHHLKTGAMIAGACMLGVIGNADEFGKPIGSDKDEGKVTYVDLLGLDDCGKLVHELTEQAVSTVSDLDQDGFLTALAESLTERTK